MKYKYVMLQIQNLLHVVFFIYFLLSLNFIDSVGFDYFTSMIVSEVNSSSFIDMKLQHKRNPNHKFGIWK